MNDLGSRRGLHEACRDVLARADLRLVIPALVVSEAAYFVGRRLGANAEAAFLRGLDGWDVEGPVAEDLTRMAQLVETDADLRLGGTDASVIALAERTGAETVITLDRRHLAAVKPSHREAFQLQPVATLTRTGEVAGVQATRWMTLRPRPAPGRGRTRRSACLR